MMRWLLLAAIVLFGLAWAGPAAAYVEEVRFGAAHNLRISSDVDFSAGDEGRNLELEAVFAAPAALRRIGSPRPYVVGSLNATGDGVSFVGAGLAWRWRFAENWAIEPSFGYVIHDGGLDADDEGLGSRDLFRSAIAIERKLGPRSAAQIYYQHLSHGELIGGGPNRGLDYVGVRVVFRLQPRAR